jgi:hypothetical protein
LLVLLLVHLRIISLLCFQLLCLSAVWLEPPPPVLRPDHKRRRPVLDDRLKLNFVSKRAPERDLVDRVLDLEDALANRVVFLELLFSFSFLQHD